MFDNKLLTALAKALFDVANKNTNHIYLDANYKLSSDDWEPYEIAVHDMHTGVRVLLFNPYVSLNVRWLGNHLDYDRLWRLVVNYDEMREAI